MSEPKHPGAESQKPNATKPHIAIGSLKIATGIRTHAGRGGRGSLLTADHFTVLLEAARSVRDKGFPELPIETFCEQLSLPMPKNVNNWKAALQRTFDKMSHNGDTLLISYSNADIKKGFAPTSKTTVRWGVTTLKERQAYLANRRAASAASDGETA